MSDEDYPPYPYEVNPVHEVLDFQVKVAHITNWFNPTPEDLDQWEYVTRHGHQDLYIQYEFLEKMSRYWGRRPSPQFRRIVERVYMELIRDAKADDAPSQLTRPGHRYCGNQSARNKVRSNRERRLSR